MKEKTIYYCTECGNETSKWQGKCNACGSWNTITEQPRESKTLKKISVNISAPSEIVDIDTDNSEVRFSTGIGEFDRVLGGGAVEGSLILIGGAPGIGKSTLLLQICGSLCDSSKILYVSGEESERQIKMRADRLKAAKKGVFILPETNLSDILAVTETYKPKVLIIDSIQTLFDSEINSLPGSVAQVKHCTIQLMHLAKSRNITIFVIGHVNKEGAIAGPRVLEHIVDCVLYFEGDRHQIYRILRSAKNRFGSTNEIGVFEMQETGLKELPNASEVLLSERPINTPGTCVACIMEGSRPILAEIQVLLTTSSLSLPRRNSNGFDTNRAWLLLAVLEKRGGLRIGNCDAYINVIGGLNLDEPAADLAMIIAAASSFYDIPAGNSTVAIGEVGLTGELRSVSHLEQRLKEVARLGFDTCIISAQGTQKINSPKGLKLIRASNIVQALDAVLQR